eukprot:3757884-Prymnesium_polylepis.1
MRSMIVSTGTVDARSIGNCARAAAHRVACASGREAVQQAAEAPPAESLPGRVVLDAARACAWRAV